MRGYEELKKLPDRENSQNFLKKVRRLSEGMEHTLPLWEPVFREYLGQRNCIMSLSLRPMTMENTFLYTTSQLKHNAPVELLKCDGEELTRRMYVCMCLCRVNSIDNEDFAKTSSVKQDFTYKCASDMKNDDIS